MPTMALNSRQITDILATRLHRPALNYRCVWWHLAKSKSCRVPLSYIPQGRRMLCVIAVADFPAAARSITGWDGDHCAPLTAEDLIAIGFDPTDADAIITQTTQPIRAAA